MWKLGDKAERANKLPSECIPGLDEIACDWTIWMFDNAIHFFMSVMHAALSEREKIGDAKNAEWKAKYTLSQLLEDEFRLPRPISHKAKRGQTGQQVKALFGSATPRKRKGKDKGKPMLNPLMQKWLQRHGSKAA